MSIFNQVIAGLTGERSLRQTRDRSISAAQKAFDPSVFDPQLDVARQQATQGIDEGLYRRNVLNQLFRPVDASVYGGNQAAAIAGTASVDASRAQAMGQFEGNLAMQDATMRQAGAQQVGQLQSQQLQTQAQREGYMDAIRAEYSSEVDDRRRLLATSVAKFGIEAAGGAGAIGGAIGGGLSALKDKAELGLAGLRGMFDVAPTDVPVAQLTRPLMGMEGLQDFDSMTWGLNSIRQNTARTFDATFAQPVVEEPVVEEVENLFSGTNPTTPQLRTQTGGASGPFATPSIMGLKPIGEYGSFEEYDQAQRAAAGGAPSYQAMQVGQARAAGAIGSVAGAVGRGFWAVDQFFSPVARGRQLLEALSPDARRRRFEEQRRRFEEQQRRGQ